MNRYAVIKGGQVINVIIWDPNANPTYKHHDDAVVLVPCDDMVEPGWTWDGESFSPPAASQ